MRKLAQRIKDFVFRTIHARRLKLEYKNQKFDSVNERPLELAFTFRCLAEIYPKTVLDVGTGMTALPHLMRNCGFHVTATDNIRDYWSTGMFNHHFHIIDDDITDTNLTVKFDFITCISVLEHIHKYDAAVESMSNLVSSGGYIALSFPYNEKKYEKNVYELSDSCVDPKSFPFVTQAFSREQIDTWASRFGLTILKQEYWQYFTGEYWATGQPIVPPKLVTSEERHQITCILFKAR